jgi:beta-glucosidase/6-phospho-beta-glucosidase/beta-galactosidase
MRAPSLVLPIAAIALAAAPFACGSSTEDLSPAPKPDAGAASDAPPADGAAYEWAFPKGFLFGTATAGFQVDMGCPTLPPAQCDDPNSDWFAFSTSPEMIADGKNHLSGENPSKTGPGFWELYESDLDRAQKELKNNAFRMSFEWSRIFPTKTDSADGYDALKAIANADAIARYHAIFAALKARGMTPLVTLNHYTLPTWIHDGVGCHKDLEKCSPRGWLDKDRTLREIAKYAGFVAKEFGKEVDLWATLNEPMAVAIPGYLQPSADRSNPPAQMLKEVETKAVLFALVEAHARMYDAVKANDTEDADGQPGAASVGVVYNMTPFAPNDPDSELDKKAVENLFYLWNLAFLDAVCLGQFDEALDGNKVQRADLAGRMDYLGINYYVQAAVTGTSKPFLPNLSPKTTFNPFSLKMDVVYPRGLYEMVMYAKNNYKVPIYITENGTGHAENESVIDGYMADHFRWLLRAIKDGADVRGYFYWTLVDNVEWNHGMQLKFGLYAVDSNDPQKKRTPRRGATVYASIAGSGTLPKELVDQHPEPDAGSD